MEQCNVQHAIGGLEATEGYLSTPVDLTKQVEPSIALTPWWGVVWPLNGSKTEGRKVCVYVFESLPVKKGGRECVHCTLSP